ncbi:hypothetical protein FNV43_RR26696 [Rhamnella rubrinervis]|uniref:Uncharacterized protein n=1 Tax=Rhamnella rubrinervis TaxID=2594499 RepID=A0A8K0DJ92_9ROSA|nr:hypothetical protein FNV43_RR26696 [Rhamnella rubrinervis]
MARAEREKVSRTLSSFLDAIHKILPVFDEPACTFTKESQYHLNPLSIPYGLAAAASTRVSNELRAGNSKAAWTATLAVMFLAVAEACIISIVLFVNRRVFRYAYSNEKEVVDYVPEIAHLVCVSHIFYGLQGILSGLARGCGWQDIEAYINLGAYCLCGIPTAAIFGFLVKLRGKGLWIGVQGGAFVQTLLLSLLTIFLQLCRSLEQIPLHLTLQVRLSIPEAITGLVKTRTTTLVGMSSALETLCGQANGAEQYQKLGLQTYTTIFTLFLILSDTDSHNSNAPKLYCHALFPHSSLLVLGVQVWTGQPWWRVGYRNFELVECGYTGIVRNVFSSSCAKTGSPISTELFHGVGECLRLAQFHLFFNVK